MKVWMIGTQHCIKCKQIAPTIEMYCKDHDIDYEYVYLEKASQEIIDTLVKNNVKQAPAFIIYREDNNSQTVVSGDDIFLELNISK